MNIAIYCGSLFGNDEIYENEAKKLVYFLSKKNASIVYGGSKSGLMGTISQEAIRLKVNIYGVTTHNLAHNEIENNKISKLFKVNNIRERKAKMEELSDAFIAFPGGFGTLEEITEVFTSIQIGSHQKPCALYNINGYFDDLIIFLQKCVDKGFINQTHLDSIIVSDNINFIYNSFKNYKAPKTKWEV